MAIRAYEFIVGPETSNIPTASDPVVDADTVTKGYADATYTPRAHVRGKASDLTELKAITSAQRFNEQHIFLAGTGKVYEFDSASVATGDDDFVVTPAAGTGRWLKVIDGAGTVGGGAGAGISLLEQKLDAEHSGIFTDPLPVSVGSSFAQSFPVIEGRLLEDYASGTAASVVWNPKFIEDADENTDSAANWLAHDAVTINLTTSATAKIGAASLSFDKTTGGTFAGIYLDRGVADLYINGNGECVFWVNLPSITNLTNIEIRLGDATNYEYYTATLNHAGGALATGAQLMKFDVSVPGTSVGTGWDITMGTRRLTIGLNTSSAAQTYTAVLIDAIHFGLSNPERFVQIGNEYSIYDASNSNTLKIDSTSVRVQGTIVLDSALGDAMDGGDVSTIKRSTMDLLGDGAARMVDGLSGEIADTQTIRLQAKFPESTSGANMKVVLDLESNMVFKVTAVPSSTAIEVEDPADLTANIVSGRVYHVFETLYDAYGKQSYEYRTLDLTVSSSSHSSGTTMINTGTNTGVAIGDYVYMKAASVSSSVVAKASEETFASLSIDELQIIDNGMSYPQSQSVFGHWYLGGRTDAIGLNNNKGPGVDLTEQGSMNLQASFLNGQYGAKTYSGANYLQYSASTSSVNGSVLAQHGIWFYVIDAFTGVRRILWSRENSVGSGVSLALGASANTLSLYVDGGVLVSTSTFNLNTWNFAFVKTQAASGAQKVWLNTILSSASTTYTALTSPWNIGRDATGPGDSFGSGILADYFVIDGGTELTQGEINQMYASGLHKRLGFAPKLKSYYLSNGQTGQKATIKANLVRTTDTAIHSVSKFGAIRTN